jgi:hypothetical protein
VKDVTEAHVSSFDEVIYIINEGQNNRQKAVTSEFFYAFLSK